MGTVAVGPGTLGLAVVYATNPNAYYNKAEWAIAAEYAIKATDKLKITPAVQYYSDYGVTAGEFNDGDAWKAGVTIDYQIVENLSTKISVQYLDPEDADDVTSGFFRLQRAF
jgi:long-subunit fatty acid transport protein